MTKPTVNVRPVANSYGSKEERIIEVTNGIRTDTDHKGALVSIRSLSDGRLCIEVYRADPGVVVRAEPHTNATADLLAALEKAVVEIEAHWTRDELEQDHAGMEVALDKIRAAIAKAQTA